MSAVPNTFTRDGYTYVMTHAPSRRTLQVCARLGNASAAFVEGMGRGRGAGRLANAAAYLLSSPELGPTLDFVVSEFAPYTQVAGPTGSATLSDCVDAHFAGRMTAFAEWIENVIAFECGDFLGEMVERLGASLAEAVKGDSVSKSPPNAGTTG